MVGPKPPAAMQTPPTWRFLNVLPNWRKQKEVENISVINARLTVTRSNSWHRWGHVSSSPPPSSVHCATQAYLSALHLSSCILSYSRTCSCFIYLCFCQPSLLQFLGCQPPLPTFPSVMATAEVSPAFPVLALPLSSFSPSPSNSCHSSNQWYNPVVVFTWNPPIILLHTLHGIIHIHFYWMHSNLISLFPWHFGHMLCICPHIGDSLLWFWQVYGSGAILPDSCCPSELMFCFHWELMLSVAK